MAASSLRLASSPELTVSTLWPSRRNAMSSISQMERSSSQTRMLAMRSLLCAGGCCQCFHFNHCPVRGLLRGVGESFAHSQPFQTQHEFAALSGLGPCPNFSFVRLDYLIHNGETEPCAALELRLKRLKNLARQLRRYPGAGVRETELPIFSNRVHRDLERALLPHGAQGIFT